MPYKDPQKKREHATQYNLRKEVRARKKKYNKRYNIKNKDKRADAYFLLRLKQLNNRPPRPCIVCGEDIPFKRYKRKRDNKTCSSMCSRIYLRISAHTAARLRQAKKSKEAKIKKSILKIMGKAIIKDIIDPPSLKTLRGVLKAIDDDAEVLLGGKK